MHLDLYELLRERRLGTWLLARELAERACRELRGFTQPEAAWWHQLIATLDQLDDQIRQAEIQLHEDVLHPVPNYERS